MRPATRVVLLFGVCLASSCVQILGDFKQGQTGGSASSTGGSGVGGLGGMGGSTSQSSSTGLVCVAPTPTVCPSGCADLTTDTHNCGACGHDCMGAVCSKSLCTPTPVVSTTTTTSGCDIAVDSTHVYWTDSTSVLSALKAGGIAKSLVSTSGPCHPAVDATDVYYVAASALGGQVVAKVPVVGGAEVAMAQSQAAVADIAVDMNSIYWTHSGGVSKLAKVNGALITLAQNQSNPHRMALDTLTGVATKIYWTDQAVSGQVNSAPAAALGPVFTYASAENEPDGVTVDATQVYWLDATSLNAAPIGTATPMKLQAGLVGATQLHTDGINAYWLELPAGTIKSVSLVAPTAKPLLLVASGATNLAVDNTYLYWTTSSSILRISK